MNLLDLLSLNWNLVTMVGLIIGIFILLYIIFRFATGFINPFNTIDKFVFVILIIDILMVWFYSIFENILYTRIGQVLFFGSLFILVLYFLLFYGNGKPKTSGGSKKSSSYKRIVVKSK